MFARLQKIAARVDLDDEGQSLNEVDTVLRRLGISLTDTEGNFRKMGDVLDEINLKWKTFTNTEQAQIATAVAGVRQRESFLVLMEAYGKASQYTETSLNSAGTAMEKFEAYENSLEAQTQKLKATFEGLVNNFSLFGAKGDEAYSNLIKLGTALVQVADDLRLLNIALGVLATAALPKLLGTLGQTATVLKLDTFIKGLNTSTFSLKAFFTQLFSIDRVKNTYNNALRSMSGFTLEEVDTIKHTFAILDKQGNEYIKNINGWAQGVHQYNKVIKEGTSGMTKFAAGFSAATPYIMMATVAIELIVAAVQAYKRHQEELRNEAIEQSSATLELTKTTEEWSKSLADLNAKLEEEDITGQEYLETSKQIAEIKDQVVQAFKDKTSAVYDYTASLEDNIKALNDQTHAEWEHKSSAEYMKASRTLAQQKTYSAFLGTSENLGYRAIQEAVKGIGGADIGVAAGATLAAGFGENGQTQYKINIKGTADEAIKKIDEIQDKVRQMREQNLISISEEREALQLLQDTRSDIQDEDYKKNKELARQGAEIIAQGDKDYRTYYNNLTKYQAEYDKAIADGKEEAQKDTAEKLEQEKKKLREFLYDSEGNIKSGIDANVADYFEELLKDLDAETVRTRLTLEFETTPTTRENFKNAVNNLFDSAGIEQRFRTTETLKLALADMTDEAKDNSEAYQLLSTTADQYGVSIEGLINVLGDLEVVDKSFSDQIQEAQKSFATLQGEIKTWTENLEDINNAQTEYNENGFITLETLDKLLNLGSDYKAMLIDEEGQLNLNTTSEEDLARSILEAMMARKLEEINAYIKGLQSEYQTVDELAKHYDDLKLSALDAAAAQALAIDAKTGKITTNAYGEMALAQDATLRGMVAEYQSVRAAIGGISSSGKGKSKKSSGSSKSGSSKDTWLEAYKEELAELDHLKKMDKITTKEYYNELERLTHKYFTGRDKYHKEERENLEKLWDLYKQILDEEKERYETTVKYVDDVIDKKIEALEKEKEALEKKNKAQEDEIKLEQLQANLRKAQQRTMRVYYEDVGKMSADNKGDYIG